MARILYDLAAADAAWRFGQHCWRALQGMANERETGKSGQGVDPKAQKVLFGNTPSGKR